MGSRTLGLTIDSIAVSMDADYDPLHATLNKNLSKRTPTTIAGKNMKLMLDCDIVHAIQSIQKQCNGSHILR